MLISSVVRRGQKSQGSLLVAVMSVVSSIVLTVFKMPRRVAALLEDTTDALAEETAKLRAAEERVAELAARAAGADAAEAAVATEAANLRGALREARQEILELHDGTMTLSRELRASIARCAPH